MNAPGEVTAGKRAILLDALGTLVELEPPAPRLMDALRRWLGLEVTLEQAERAVAAEIAYYRAHLDEGRDYASLAALRRRCAEAIGRALSPPADPAMLDGALLTRALLESLRFRPYPEVAGALAALRRPGRRLVVVSNWDVSLPDVLKGVGLADHLDAVLTSAAVGARKPAPEIFHAALRAAGVAAADAIHVGDSPEEDVGGAQAAGIEPVLLVRASRRPGAPPGRTPGAPVELSPGVHRGVRTIRSLAELV